MPRFGVSTFGYGACFAMGNILKSSMAIFRHLPRICFAGLFAWISFLPEPISRQYVLTPLIFLFFFYIVLLCSKSKTEPIAGLEDWPLWVFLILLAAGVLEATDRNIAFSTYYSLATNMLLAFYVGKGMFSREKERNFVVMMVCFCAVIVSLLGLFETLFAFNPIYVYFVKNIYYHRHISEVVRPMSTMGNPAALATYLLLAWPFSIYFLKQQELPKRILGTATMILTTVCLVLAFSRGSFAGLIVMAVFSLSLEKDRKRLLFYGLFIAVILCAASFLPHPFNRFSLEGIFFSHRGIFSTFRTARFNMAVQMFKDSPFWGIGLNHFRVLFDHYYPVKSQIVAIFGIHKIADNMYLTLLAEAGLAGFSGFLIFIFSLFIRGIRKFRALKKGPTRTLLLILLISLAGFLADMSGYEVLYWPNLYLFFCLICGLAQGVVMSREGTGAVSHG